jgi:hypothetical protein
VKVLWTMRHQHAHNDLTWVKPLVMQDGACATTPSVEGRLRPHDRLLVLSGRWQTRLRPKDGVPGAFTTPDRHSLKFGLSFRARHPINFHSRRHVGGVRLKRLLSEFTDCCSRKAVTSLEHRCRFPSIRRQSERSGSRCAMGRRWPTSASAQPNQSPLQPLRSFARVNC